MGLFKGAVTGIYVCRSVALYPAHRNIGSYRNAPFSLERLLDGFWDFGCEIDLGGSSKLRPVVRHLGVL
jgi:hypothetical protein